MYFSISNVRKSSSLSPIPTNLTGISKDSLIAKTIPPLAVPSNLVSTIPVISVIFLNSLAWLIPFWPVVASTTNKVSCGASGNTFPITLLIFSN